VVRHCQGQAEVETDSHQSKSPKPPGAWWLKGTSGVNDYNYCYKLKGTQPGQTCSDGYTFFFLLLHVTGVFLCTVFGKYQLARLD